jgi:hypothetical protein
MKTSIPYAADFIQATAFSLEELRAALQPGHGKISPALAVSLLGVRDYPERLEDLSKALTTPEVPLQARIAAASALGRLRTPAAREMLQKQASTPHTALKRAIGKALGEELPAPVKRASPPSSAPAAAKAESPAGRAKPEPPVVRAPEAEDLAELAAERLTENFPSVQAAGKAQLAIECDGQKMLVFRRQEAGEPITLSTLRQTRKVVAVCAMRFDYHRPNFIPRFLLEMGPGPSAGELEVRLVFARRRTVVAQANGKISGESVGFLLKSGPGPGYPAFELDGAWTNGNVVLNRITTFAEQAPKALPPRRDPKK